MAKFLDYYDMGEKRPPANGSSRPASQQPKLYTACLNTIRGVLSLLLTA
jgi:hypothetical protein